MRRFRRLTAAITSLLMIHLAIAGSAMACPFGDEASAGAAMPGDSGHTMHAAQHAALHTAQHAALPATRHAEHALTRERGDSHSSHDSHGSHGGSHCAMPCLSVGCSAAGTCSSASMRGLEYQLSMMGASGARRTRVNVDVPRSVSVAPEPPPPRA